MSQVAQQEPFYIDVGEVGLDELTGDVKEVIRPIIVEKFKAGILPDCIIRNAWGDFAKILYGEWDNVSGDMAGISIIYEDSVVWISL